MTGDIENLILEHLRAIRADVADIKADIRDLKESQIGIREEIQALRRDALRQERTIAHVQVDLDRVQARLNLRDA
jgi:hypothetical protein